MLVSAWVGLRFFCCLFREEQQRLRALLEENRQKEGLAITLVTAIIASPHYHEE